MGDEYYNIGDLTKGIMETLEILCNLFTVKYDYAHLEIHVYIDFIPGVIQIKMLGTKYPHRVTYTNLHLMS